MMMDGDFPVPSFPVIFRYNNDDDFLHAPLDEAEDESEERLPAIFTKDPKDWMRFVDHRVDMVLDDGVVKSGVVRVIDPVSEAIVLVRRSPASGGQKPTSLRVEIIPHHVVKEMKVVEKADASLLADMAKAFDDESSEEGRGGLSEEELVEKKNRVKDWLTANRIPVEVSGINSDVIEVAGKALIIKPPYDVENCFSLNEIILKKVQQLLRNQSS